MKTRGDWTVLALPGAVMAWTSPTGTVHQTTPNGGNHVSHPDRDTVLPDRGWDAEPERARERGEQRPWQLDGSHVNNIDLPDPWDGFDLQRLIAGDPSPAEFEQRLTDSRFDRATPDPEEPPHPSDCGRRDQFTAICQTGVGKWPCRTTIRT